jgi:hypothetical protein
LRRLASGDAAELDEVLTDLCGSIFHQGSVCPATVAAVAFLVELAHGARAKRDELTWLVGMLGDPYHAYDPPLAQVQAALAGQVDRIAGLLADPDPAVRAAAPYAFVHSRGTAERLWPRWAIEDDAAARASLLLALGHTAAPGFDRLAASAVTGDDLRLRVPAATVLLRAGAPWPAGAIGAALRAMPE